MPRILLLLDTVPNIVPSKNEDIATEDIFVVKSIFTQPAFLNHKLFPRSITFSETKHDCQERDNLFIPRSFYNISNMRRGAPLLKEASVESGGDASVRETR